MTKIKIGYNEEAERHFKKDVEAKISAYNELLELIGKYVKVEDKTTFLSNIPNNFKTAFLDRYESDFPPLVSYDTMLKLSEVPIGRIYQLAEDYNSINVECFDAETGKADTHDFTIYANNEAEVERYKLSNELAEQINKIRETGTHIYIGSLVQSVNNIISFDFVKNQFTASLNYVQSNRVF